MFQADETKSRDFEKNPCVRRFLAALRTEFSSPRHLQGHTVIKMTRLHLSCLRFRARGKSKKRGFCFFKNFFKGDSLFPQKPLGKLGAKTKNLIFVFANKESKENLGELSPAKRREKKGSALWA